jgi:nucleotide-binding universal stress UspA family protein
VGGRGGRAPRRERGVPADDDGALRPAVQDVLRLARHHDLVLSTGHASWREALVLAREAAAIGFDRLVFGHPLSGSVGAPPEVVREAAALGAYIEFCWPTVAPGRRDPAEVVALAAEVGADRVVLTSDHFTGASPSPSDLLRVFLGVLFDHGMAAKDIHRAVAVNPAALLGLDQGGSR